MWLITYSLLLRFRSSDFDGTLRGRGAYSRQLLQKLVVTPSHTCSLTVKGFI